MAVKYHIKGMTCMNCARNIELYLQRQGVKHFHIDYGAETLILEEEINEAQLRQWIREIGYDIETIRLRRWEWKLIHSFFISLIFTVPLVLGMFVDVLHHGVLQFILATPVLFLGIKHFGASALGSLRIRQANMDVLILLGSITAYLYSVIMLLQGKSEYYFETSASILTIIFLGNVLEQYALSYARRSYQGLESLLKEKVRCYRDGKWVEVEAEELAEGDRILLQEGMAVPVDGKLLQGSIVVDESILTGESVGVIKKVGDEVLSGSVVMKGNGELAVLQSVRKGFIARLIELSEKVQRERPRVQQIADRISGYFVPTVVGIAFITFLGNMVLGQPFSEAMMRAIAVLVIACPCALGIATPTALLVGTGKATRLGILIRDADAFELLSRAQFVLFDKTGTLTWTNRDQIQIHLFGEESIEKVKCWIKGLVIHSLHPISVALQKALEEVREATFREVKEIKGQGLEGIDTEGVSFRLGNRQFTGVPSDVAGNVFLVRDGKLIASMEIQEEIVQGAKELIAYLKKLRKKVVLISGDRCERVRRVAKELGIEEYHCEQKPEEKLKWIEAYSQKGITVMIGDGINDAPALARSHVGIAMTEKSQLAAARAKVVVLNQEPKKIKSLFAIARITYRLTKQNLFWAFFYNVIAIPMAMAGLLHPIVASFSMAFSDLVIVGNALRYRLVKVS